MKAKKLVAVLRSVALVLSFTCAPAFAASSVNGNTVSTTLKSGATVNLNGTSQYKAYKSGSSIVVKYTKDRKKSATKVTIPSYITVKGKKYKVYSIASKVFKGTKCKTLTIKSTKIKASVAKKAIKSSKVKYIKVPKSMYKAYKKYFKHTKIKVKKF